MIQDGFEAAIVFLPSFIQVVAQSYANVFILSSHSHVFGPKHLDVLHGYFGHPLGAPMQLLKLRGEVFDIEGRDLHGDWGGFGYGHRHFDGRRFGLRRTPFGNFIGDLRCIGRGLFFHSFFGLLLLNFVNNFFGNFSNSLSFGLSSCGNHEHGSGSLSTSRRAIARL